jgi:type IV pilus assembly protein PilA
MTLDVIPFILGILAFFGIIPLLLYFPIYISHFLVLRRIARKKGPHFKPSYILLALNIWMVLVIGAILLFLPNFLQFNGKAKQAEAKVNLGAIYTAQKAYFAEHHQYAGRKGENGSGTFADLGWSPEGDSLYAYYEGGDYLAPTKPAANASFMPPDNWPYSIHPDVSAHGFTALAIGNVDRDPCQDVWMINDANHLVNLTDDTRNLVRENIGGECGEVNASRLAWYDFMESRFVRYFIGFFGLTSPLMIFVIPVMYYLANKQNLLYYKAMAAMAEKEPHI